MARRNPKQPKGGPDAPRLLHRNPGMGRSDYTDRPGMAVPGEPEAVSAEAQAAISRAARERFDLVRAEERLRRQAKSAAGKLREATALAVRRRVDITHDLERVHRELDGLRRRLDREAR